MHCTKCGAELTPGAKFCVTCGSVVEAAPVAPAAPVEPVAPIQTAPAAEKKEGFKIDVTAVKDQLVETLKPITDKVKPLFAKKAVRFGVIGAFALLLVLGIVFGLLGANGDYVMRKQTTKLEMIDGKLNIIIDGKLQKKSIEVGYQRDNKGEIVEVDGKKQYLDYTSSSSMDGKVTAVWVYGDVYEGEDSWYSYNAGDLYVINGKKIQLVAEDVCSYELSVSGKGISYLTKNDRDEDDKYTTYTLKLYNVGNKKTTSISDEVASTSLIIAPNGKSVSFFEADEGEEGKIEYTLMYSNGKDPVKVTSHDVYPIGMSDNGKYIYAVRTVESEDKTEYSMYCYNTKGDAVRLGKSDSGTAYNAVFNKDHTQLMFVGEKKTYVSTKGKEGVKAYSGELYLITPSGTGYASQTEPVSNLYGKVYAASDDEGNRSVWKIEKNSDKNAKLASKATNFQLDGSGEYLYYMYDGEDIRCTKVSYGEKATEKFTTLAEDAEGFFVTNDRKYVYFASDDTLYSTNGKKGGKKTIICVDDWSDVTITNDGRLYYVMDEDLYVTNNGKRGKKVLSDVEDVYSSTTGIVYAETEDALYVSTGAKKLKKILDLG